MKVQETWYRLGNPDLVFSHAYDWWLDLLQLAYRRSSFYQDYRRIRPYTLCGHRRLRALYEAIAVVESQRVVGEVVECGTARGGSAAFMGLAMKRLGSRRTLWVFDTFEGLPPPTRDNPDWNIAALYAGEFRASLEDVAALFDRLGLRALTKFVKGLFEETLPTCSLSAIAVLHIDSDWYESVKTCLTHLYDRVSPGGIIQIDDYGHWKGARKAVDEFLRERLPTASLRRLDYSGRQLVKPR